MLDNPKITVGVPVYNVEPYLVQCLRSIAGQEYKNLDILIIDDGSTDNSGYIADEYAKHDSRMRVIHHRKNESLTSCRNDIVEEMAGELLYWVDSDDYLELNAISSCLDTMRETGADIVKTAIVQGDDKCVGEYTSEEFLKILLPDTIKSHVIGSLFKKEMYQGIQHDETRNMGDYDTLPSIAEHANKIVVVANGSYVYRDMRTGSITQSARDKFPGYNLRAYMTNKRYVSYNDRFPSECEFILKQFTDYACMTNLFAQEGDDVLPVRAMMYDRERAVMINEQISGYKKLLYRSIINHSPFVPIARCMHKTKRTIKQVGKKIFR